MIFYITAALLSRESVYYRSKYCMCVGPACLLYECSLNHAIFMEKCFFGIGTLYLKNFGQAELVW